MHLQKMLICLKSEQREDHDAYTARMMRMVREKICAKESAARQAIRACLRVRGGASGAW